MFFFIPLLWYCFHCNALRAAIAGLSCCLQFLLIPHGSYYVLHATSFIPFSVTLHFTSFVATHLLHGWAFHSQSQSKTHGMNQPFASHRYNTHWVPFRFTTSFIHFGSVQSTRCPLFCSPAIPTSAAFAKVLRQHITPDTWLIRPSFRHAALSSLASFRRLRTLTGNILRRLPK